MIVEPRTQLTEDLYPSQTPILNLQWLIPISSSGQLLSTNPQLNFVGVSGCLPLYLPSFLFLLNWLLIHKSLPLLLATTASTHISLFHFFSDLIFSHKIFSTALVTAVRISTHLSLIFLSSPFFCLVQHILLTLTLYHWFISVSFSFSTSNWSLRKVVLWGKVVELFAGFWLAAKLINSSLVSFVFVCKLCFHIVGV